MSNDITRKMLTIIREHSNNNRDLICEDSHSENSNGFVINKSTPNFGDLRDNQIDVISKTIGENLEFSDDALMYYKDNRDLILNGKIISLNLTFQFRYNDPSGDGCYIWCNSSQLTDNNLRTIGKIRDAFLNWKESLLQNGDIFDKLNKTIENN